MKNAIYTSLALLLLFLVSCDKTEVWPRVNRDDLPGTEYLAVLSTSPSSGQTGIPVTATISVTFNDNVDLSTVDDATSFTVNSGSVTGSFNYDEGSRTVEFTPGGGLVNSTVYTVRLTTDIETLVGDTLEADYQFQFTTADPADALIQLSHVDTVTIIPYSGSFEYGYIGVGDTSPETFRITNVGSDVLTVNDITLVGGDFDIPTPFTGTITAGDSEDFDVTFNPATAGDKSAVVNIDSNDANHANFLFTVTGTAVTSSEPDIALYQGSTEIAYDDQYNFAKYGLGEVSPPIPFTIKNHGNANLVVNTIQLTDDAGLRFTIVTNPAPDTISPGDEVVFEIRFSSPNGVVFFGTVEITSNDPDEDPFVFRVKGMAK